jgi:hypothetical protein
MSRLNPSRGIKPVLAMAVLLLALPVVAQADTGPEHRVIKRPLWFGTSGGNANDISRRVFCSSGTLGALVQDATNPAIQYILSNNHVLARINEATLEEDITQPGLIDIGCRPSATDHVADLSRFVEIKWTPRGSPPVYNKVDAAIAKVLPDKLDSAAPGRILDIGSPSSAWAPALLGAPVQKSGRTTGHTDGTVAAVDVDVLVDYGSRRLAWFQDQTRITPAAFSDGGDSGSLILNSNREAVGLLFAGSSTDTIANRICDVLAELRVGMLGGSGQAACPEALVGQLT